MFEYPYSFSVIATTVDRRRDHRLPQYDATIGQAASRSWREFAVFSGRASRSEYWWWALIAFVIAFALQLVGSLVFGGGLFLDPTDTSLDPRRVQLPLAPSLVWSPVTLVPSRAVRSAVCTTQPHRLVELLVLPALPAWRACRSA